MTGAPSPHPRRIELHGPPGTNDGRRFVLPPGWHRETLAALEGVDAWELRADYGEGETTILMRGAASRFASLADFWVDVGLTHERFSGLDERPTWTTLARRLLSSREDPVEQLEHPREQAACGQSGFAHRSAVVEFARLRGPVHRGLRLCHLWNEVTDVLESDQAYFIAAWSTSA